MIIRVRRAIAFVAALHRASAVIGRRLAHSAPPVSILDGVAFANHGSCCPHKPHQRWHRRPRALMSIVDDSGETFDIPDTSRGNDCEEGGTERSLVLLGALTKSVQKARNKLSRKTDSLQQELVKAQSLEETLHRANLLLANLYRLPPGTTSAEIEDWENDGQIIELELNTEEYRSAQEETEALFSQARKMKRGSKIVEGLLAQSARSLETLDDALRCLDSMADGEIPFDEGTLIVVQERLERTWKDTGFRPPELAVATETNTKAQGNETNKRRRDTRNKPNPRILTSPSGLKVLVGRNRRDNEAICFQLAKPTDVWMHSRGYPGAHVLLCIRRGGPEVKDEDFQFAANLAAFYSDARTETRAKITTANPKHITKPRGAPLGAVSLRQEGKTWIGRPHGVSYDLKEAGEKSGVAWDECGYQKSGIRAKNKKKTAAAEKAEKDKNREVARGKNKRKNRMDEQDWY